MTVRTALLALLLGTVLGACTPTVTPIESDRIERDPPCRRQICATRPGATRPLN